MFGINWICFVNNINANLPLFGVSHQVKTEVFFIMIREAEHGPNFAIAGAS
jgi:hypothetical protein